VEKVSSCSGVVCICKRRAPSEQMSIRKEQCYAAVYNKVVRVLVGPWCWTLDMKHGITRVTRHVSRPFISPTKHRRQPAADPFSAGKL